MNPKTDLTVSRPPSTMRSQVTENIRTAIVRGDFAPGERLVERKLCDMLGVSRTLVREGLRQLEAEGIVENIPFRGPSVALVTAHDARQIYEFRAALEGFAARLFVRRATDQDIARLAAAVGAIEKSSFGGRHADRMKAIDAYYTVLLEGCGNVLINSYLELQRTKLSTIRRASLSFPGREKESLAEKKAILQAIRDRDEAAAQRASETHIANALQAALQALDVE